MLGLKVANIGVTAVVARILSPEDFGIFALAAAVFAVVSTLAEMGVSSALTRADLSLERDAPTVVTITIVAGLAIAGAMAALAEPLATAFNNQAAAEPILVLALGLALWIPFAVPHAQLTRDFQQRRIFLANAVSFGLANTLMIVLALNGSGAMAFAWSRVLGMVVLGLVVWFSVSPHYRPGLDRRRVGPLLKFGIPLAAASLLSQLNLNLDYLLIGRMMDATSVGLYLLAFNVAGWASALVTAAIQGVAVPAVSRVSHDQQRLHRAVATSTRLVSLIAFPVAAVSLALATPIVVTLYGQRYAAAAPALMVLSAYGAVYALSVLFGQILVGIGKTAVLLKVQVAVLVALGPALAVGIHFLGIVGAAAAHAVVIWLVTVPVYVRTIVRATGQPLRPLVGAVAPPLAASLVVGAVVWLTARSVASPVLELLVGGIVAVIALALLCGPMTVSYLPDNVRSNRWVSLLEVPGRWSRSRDGGLP